MFRQHDRGLVEGPRARRLESYGFTEATVHLAVALDVEGARREVPKYGLDTSLPTLVAVSDGTLHGRNVQPMVVRITRCSHGSIAQKRACRAFHQGMAEVAQEVTSLNPRWVVTEELHLLSHGRTIPRRVSKNMCHGLGVWAHRDWLDRLERACDVNRVRFERVPPACTRQRCHVGGPSERGNRKARVFRGRKCGFAGNADANATKNLRIRLWGREPLPTGSYGVGFQPGGVG